MVAYNIGSLPLIKRLKSEYYDVTQLWYADNSGALATFNNLERYFNLLKRHGPARGYFPDSNKIIMIMRSNNPKAGELFGTISGFRVCTGARYLDGYIRYFESKGDWLKNCTDKLCGHQNYREMSSVKL